MLKHINSAKNEFVYIFFCKAIHERVKSMSLTIFAGGNINPENALGMEPDKVNNTKRNSGTFFAGNSNLDMDPIVQRRKEARKKAWEVVSSAWDSDKNIDASVQERRDRYAQMRELEEESNNELNRINGEMDDLKKKYNIDSESKEQKDLELIMKYKESKKDITAEKLTDEEMEQYNTIDKNNLTEYQNRMLELYDQKELPEKNLEDAKKEIIKAGKEITAIGIERLKKHLMVNANKDADVIMKAASDEIEGMVVKEGMEHEDERIEEIKEEADKKAEEKEEKEDKLQEIKEEKAIQEALIQGTKEAVDKAKAVEREGNNDDMDMSEMVDLTVKDIKQSGGDVANELGEIKNSMALLEADLKGIKVDKLV